MEMRNRSRAVVNPNKLVIVVVVIVVIVIVVVKQWSKRKKSFHLTVARRVKRATMTKVVLQRCKK